MKVVVLGTTGMLGSMAFRLLSEQPGMTVFGTVRASSAPRSVDPRFREKIVPGVAADDPDALARMLGELRPDVVINCVGIVKQLASAKDPLTAIPINAILPHRLARLCQMLDARLIHVSTDCVFTGSRGNYTEDDPPDAEDLYGRSKLLGEVDYPNAITLRTSIVGREPVGRNGVIEWFLNESSGRVQGYTKAIFSGLTTDELTRVIIKKIIPSPQLHGVYHVSSEPIDKRALLEIVKEVYERPTDIEPDDKVVIDRSLDSTRFRTETGYKPPSWREMIVRTRELDRPNTRS